MAGAAAHTATGSLGEARTCPPSTPRPTCALTHLPAYWPPPLSLGLAPPRPTPNPDASRLTHPDQPGQVVLEVRDVRLCEHQQGGPGRLGGRVGELLAAAV